MPRRVLTALRKLLSAFTLAAVALLFVACQAREARAPDSVPLPGPLRFPHATHAEVACTHCHEPPGPGEEPGRPGRDSHASCSSADCHKDAFREEPTMMCGLCHESLQTDEGPRATLVPYPPVAGPRAEAVRFSHAVHLNAEAMERSLGFHISCTDCHALASPQETDLGTGISELPRPTHEACARCHAEEASVPGSPIMENCTSCHDAGRTTPRERRFIRGDLQFRHGTHRADRKGKAIGCATCHSSIANAPAGASSAAAYDMQVCVRCHNDDNRVHPTKRMSRCETCHATKSAGIGALAPRSHMPATERPAGHTQAFRKDHARDADRPSANCAQCHTMLSGNRRNTCDECHQVMEPRDHVVTWREYDHGPQAATDADRCATCHQAEFCIACHRTPPRSHFPGIEFRRGGHGTLAVLNVRACITCHDRADDCTGSGCHRGDGL